MSDRGIAGAFVLNRSWGRRATPGARGRVPDRPGRPVDGGADTPAGRKARGSGRRSAASHGPGRRDRQQGPAQDGHHEREPHGLGPRLLPLGAVATDPGAAVDPDDRPATTVPGADDRGVFPEPPSPPPEPQERPVEVDPSRRMSPHRPLPPLPPRSSHLRPAAGSCRRCACRSALQPTAEFTGSEPVVLGLVDPVAPGGEGTARRTWSAAAAGPHRAVRHRRRRPWWAGGRVREHRRRGVGVGRTPRHREPGRRRVGRRDAPRRVSCRSLDGQLLLAFSNGATRPL